MTAKTPRGKFSVPFKSPASQATQASQPTSQFSCKSNRPDDELDDSLLWYPDNYRNSRPKPAQNPENNIKKTAKKMQPKKTAAKPKHKTTVKENAMPKMPPKTSETPTKIARIIPKTPTKKSSLHDLRKTPDRKTVAPRTPTFQLYGVKSPFGKASPKFSQQSTPGLTQNTLLKKLSGLKRSNGKPQGPHDQDAMVVTQSKANNLEDQVQEDCNYEMENAQTNDPNPLENLPDPSATSDDAVVMGEKSEANAAYKSQIYEKARRFYVDNQDHIPIQKGNDHTLEEATLYLISQQKQKENQSTAQKDVYNFRLSPNSQRLQQKRDKKAFREVTIEIQRYMRPFNVL